MTLTNLAVTVGKTVPAVLTIQRKYGLRTCKDYSDGYAALLRKVIYLAIFSVSAKDIKTLVQHERGLLELLKVDSVQDKPDWFETVCTMKMSSTRLLLSGYDIGHTVTGESIQTGLDFKDRAKELFDDREMGADVLRGLKRYAGTLDRIHSKLTQESDGVRDAMRWRRRVQ
ncbi:MAG: hypothetical protein ACI9OU_002217 [Candidatus Promineifilaceae bacterium]|jgi:hypothetical protein